MPQAGSPARSHGLVTLWLFGLANYLAILALLPGYLSPQRLTGLGTGLFVGAGVLSYPALYLLGALVPAAAILALAEGRRGPRAPSRARVLGCVLAVLSASALVLLLFADRRTYQIFGFHLNGFVWNLLTTPGGIASMGAGRETAAIAGGLAGAVLLVESLLFLALHRAASLRHRLRPLHAPRCVVALASALALLTLGEGLAYGWSDLHGYGSVLREATAFPIYVPVRFKHVAKALGYDPPRSHGLEVDLDDSALDYPLAPIHGSTPQPAYNVLWLCAESLRADMLDPEIMPATWALAQRSARFQEHVSGGNGTRMGVFSMFYGLPGSYWFSFLSEGRGPVLVDRLLELNYQVEAFTSDDFSYPEFSKTVWSRVAPEHLHELNTESRETWERDRENTRQIERFILERDRDRPFFVFSFFESPHARYDFPPESVIREPYLTDFNYVSSDLERDVGLIKNRYVNSVHHLDSQYAQLFAFLEAQGLSDTTVVIVTGDHGEEFMEHGRWGHNSAVSEPQIRVPLVIHLPGRAPEVVTRLSSHLDLPATLLKLLAVTNPPEQFSEGIDLFGGQQRTEAILADWDGVTYLDDEVKLRFPLTRGVGQEVSTRSDVEIAEPAMTLASRHARLVHMLEGLGRFRRTGDAS